jgi:hypothetical protein
MHGGRHYKQKGTACNRPARDVIIVILSAEITPGVLKGQGGLRLPAERNNVIYFDLSLPPEILWQSLHLQ